MKHKKSLLIGLAIAICLVSVACMQISSAASPADAGRETRKAAPTEDSIVYLPVITKEAGTTTPVSYDYMVVDTGQSQCYNNSSAISCPGEGQAFYGQDAQFDGSQPSYTLSTDGLTVHDDVTGLTWTQSPDLNGDGDIDVDDKLTFAEAQSYPDTLNAATFGGYSDWRLPSIKELYSLIDFSGTDPSGPGSPSAIPFIDTDYFAFGYGDESAGERNIDAQFWSSNVYVGSVFDGSQATFGLNLADGRIKGYPSGSDGPMTKLNYVYFVRGNTAYGINDFADNGDSTITDNATGLMWSQDDSGTPLNWEEALAWVQQKNDETYLGYSDWRLPNAKEMQSIVDYTRAPDATNSAAIDPVFNISTITNEGGQLDYPSFWTSTTHVKANGSGAAGAYICFGRALGYMNGSWIDVHGAGAQRSDSKSGDPADWPTGHGPQGDAVRIYHYVRLVRDAETTTSSGATSSEGLNLFAPLRSSDTYLMDADGTIAHTWGSDYTPGNSVYLLENGSLLRTGDTQTQVFDSGGKGGIVQEIAPDGTVTWEFRYDDAQVRQHHDIEPLPNGNVLMIAWELKTEAQAISAGRSPDLLRDGELWPDHVIEVDPSSSTVVWEWHVWDHLIQDVDPAKANYGTVADHPELVDLNYGTGGRPGGADWNHINAIDYNAELDQILLSVRHFSEIWVIDHATTTAEAAGPAGDLLYRWGNPQAYDAGTGADQQLFVQHDAQWIPAGYPGEGNILVFNNGTGRLDGDYSSIDEIVPPVDGSGSYTSYGPTAPTWTYIADTPADFYAERVSGAQRLADGNTLICDGVAGIFFEVTPAGEIVWTYDYGSDVFRVTRYASSYPGLPDTSAADTAIPTGQPPAEDSQPPADGRQPGGSPPQEAIEACSGLSQGTQCNVRTPNGTISGTCMPVETQLVCVPEGGPPAKNP